MLLLSHQSKIILWRKELCQSLYVHMILFYSNYFIQPQVYILIQSSLWVMKPQGFYPQTNQWNINGSYLSYSIIYTKYASHYSSKCLPRISFWKKCPLLSHYLVQKENNSYFMELIINCSRSSFLYSDWLCFSTVFVT